MYSSIVKSRGNLGEKPGFTLLPYTQHQQCTMSQLEVVSYLVSTLCCSKVITQARCGCGGLKLAWRRDGSVTLFLPTPGPAAVLQQRHNITDYGINHRNATLRGHTATQLGPETRSRVELQTNLREDYAKFNNHGEGPYTKAFSSYFYI